MDTILGQTETFFKVIYSNVLIFYKGQLRLAYS